MLPLGGHIIPPEELNNITSNTDATSSNDGFRFAPMPTPTSVMKRVEVDDGLKPGPGRRRVGKQPQRSEISQSSVNPSSTAPAERGTASRPASGNVYPTPRTSTSGRDRESSRGFVTPTPRTQPGHHRSDSGTTYESTSAARYSEWSPTTIHGLDALVSTIDDEFPAFPVYFEQRSRQPTDRSIHAHRRQHSDTFGMHQDALAQPRAGTSSTNAAVPYRSSSHYSQQGSKDGSARTDSHTSYRPTRHY
ncbi:hypothetical protein M422DRAFT_779796 [Sphaerobolus stellatus SS14]|uniref:Unplaced genomic scaffold SPHSTscaffold_48, whole genome shotgun sequence n=1 Tax=Sphaerobolus stellatus (strain SS14) TaxID=990650 RepID=A0A0C9V914_SPHS4|nr:hypothetical protein M422DRAFT_779796 [Sphaerobolus stellatus SS14]